MKKILLILMVSFICIFAMGAQSIVNAKMMTPFYYDSNLPVDNLSARYADAILITNVNKYIQLLNIQADPTFTNSDARKIFDESFYPYCTDENNSNIMFTNKALYPLLYIIVYQQKYGGQLSRQISLFTDSQKKQYSAIQYNILMSSRLHLATGNESNSIVSGLTFASRISAEIASNMAILAKSYISDVINPSTNANVPKNSNTLYNQDQSIQITLDTVNACEQEARMQYSNVLASANSKSPNDDLFFEWETKGLEYLAVDRNYPKALYCFTKAINLKPSKGEAWQCRGDVKWRLGDYKGAIYDHSKAISQGYAVPMNYYCKARSELMLGQYNRAAEDFKKVYLITQNTTKAESLGTFSLIYCNEILNGRGDTLKMMLSNPYALLKEPIEQMVSKSMSLNSDSTSTPSYQAPIKQPQPKTICPPGCRVYLIIGVLKGTITEVRFTTIADRTKIEDLVNSDPRFEWVRYESVPDSYLDRYPRY